MLITAICKKHASRELLIFKNDSYKKNVEYLQKTALATNNIYLKS